MKTNMQVSIIPSSPGVLTFQLIREELKSRKLNDLLHQPAVEEQCQWLPTFNNVITENLGIISDEHFLEYDTFMNDCVKAIRTMKDLEKITKMLSEQWGDLVAH